MEITTIVQAIIGLAAAIITGVVVPLIRSKLSAEKQTALSTWTTVFVKAAQQIYTATQGPEKKAYVLSMLTKKGFSVDVDEVNAAVEAAVLEVHNALNAATTTSAESGAAVHE